MPAGLISFVVPFSAEGRENPYGLSRLNALQRVVEKRGLEFSVQGSVIGSGGSKSLFAPGMARDHAVQRANGQYVLLYDVDLTHDELFWPELEKAASWLDENPLAFVMIPCLYLKRGATRRVEKDTEQIRVIWQEYLRGNYRSVINLAVASSAILMRRDTYLASGGHRPEFVGHGGEDLEFINRLSLEWPLGQRMPDHADDVKQRSIAGSQGFRRHFCYYGLPNAFNGLIVAHRWHPRPATSRYFRQRPRNDRLLQAFFAASHERGDAPPALPDLTSPRTSAVLAGAESTDIQAFRQLLPAFGRYRQIQDISQAGASEFNTLLLIAPNKLQQDLARSVWAKQGTLFILEPGPLPDQWILKEFSSDGKLAGEVVYRAVRRYYANGKNYRWIFFEAQDKQLEKVLFRFTPPDYDNLPSLPLLPEFIKELQRDHELPVDEYPGLFLDQWQQRTLAERWLRKGHKLIRNPGQFWKDSRLARWLQAS